MSVSDSDIRQIITGKDRAPKLFQKAYKYGRKYRFPIGVRGAGVDFLEKDLAELARLARKGEYAPLDARKAGELNMVLANYPMDYIKDFYSANRTKVKRTPQNMPKSSSW